MSLVSSMFSGASGLDSQSDALQVVSDNIANLNTIGYKSSRGRFEDVLGSTMMTGGQNAIGQGSRLAGVEQIFTQGSFLGTGINTDLAIDGGGFFAVRSPEGQGRDMYFTRAGQFKINTEGKLVNGEGLVVQGYNVDSNGGVTGQLTDVTLPLNRTVAPKATTTLRMNANLDSGSETRTNFDLADPVGTSNYSTGVTVYDSLGTPHRLTMYFCSLGDGTWEWHSVADGSEIEGGTPGELVEGGSGVLQFNTSGALDTEEDNSSGFSFVGAEPDQIIAFDFGTSITTDGGSGLDGATSYSAASSLESTSQNGYPAGVLSGVSFGSDGSVSGSFTNGQTRVLGQLVVAKFQNENGLARAGSTLFRETRDSGEAIIGLAGNSARGNIVSGSLEQSNVNLGQEFVNLIAFQRGFQANSRTVRAADEMLTDLVNLTR